MTSYILILNFSRTWISKLGRPFYFNCNMYNCLLLFFFFRIKQNCFWKIQSPSQHPSNSCPVLSQMGAGQATYRFSGEPAKKNPKSWVPFIQIRSGMQRPQIDFRMHHHCFNVASWSQDNNLPGCVNSGKRGLSDALICKKHQKQHLT